MNIDKRYVDDCVAEAFTLFLDNDRALPIWKALFSDAQRLAAVRFVCPRQHRPKMVHDMLRASASRAREFILAHATGPAEVWLFFGDGLGQVPSRVIRHKNLWKGVAGHFQLTGLKHGPEVEIESEDGLVHYAIVAKVKPDDFEQAILLVHERQAFMLISRQELDSEQQTIDLFSEAFAPGHEGSPQRIHWRNLIHQRCLAGDVLIKTGSDSYLDEFSVDLIGPPAALT